MNASLDPFLLEKLESPARWFVTGGAGFIGSHLVETLLGTGQEVVCLDDFSTGTRENLEAAVVAAGETSRANLEVIEGDITDPEACRRAVEGTDYVLHQAALASVPASLRDPQRIHDVNVGGTLQVFEAARAAGISRIVYASSSAVYGDDQHEVKREDHVGTPLSPYAATKTIMETWAKTYSRCYGIEFVGLRYFNVYGSRQDPSGPYAAVIPIWEKALKEGSEIRIFGDGKTTRDFIHVSDVVRSNLAAALVPLPPETQALAINVGTGIETSLLDLFETMRSVITSTDDPQSVAEPVFESFRKGDIRKSVADVGMLENQLSVSPGKDLEAGIRELLA